MIKITPLRLKRSSFFLALLSLITLSIISCKKQLLISSDEIVDPKTLERNIAYTGGPKLSIINLNDFKKQVNIESLGTLAASFKQHDPNKGKLMSVNTQETFKGFNIQTDQISVIETNAAISYVFPVKLYSPRAVSFQNLTIQRNKANGSTIAFVNTYTPSKKWIDDWKLGRRKQFDGKRAVTFLNIDNSPLPVGPITSKKNASIGKIMSGDQPVCNTITYYAAEAYQCAANEHWPGDNRCILQGNQRAGYAVVSITFDDCDGDGGGSESGPGEGGGGYNHEPGGGGSDSGSGGGGSEPVPGGGSGGGGTGPGTIPTPPGNYDPCLGMDPGNGGLNVVNGATGAKLMISQPVECDPNSPPTDFFDPYEPINLPYNFELIDYSADWTANENEFALVMALVWQQGIDKFDPVPEKYYILSTPVNMMGAPARQGYTVKGAPRNNDFFWKELARLRPEMFSKANRENINRTRALSPIIDDQWIQYNPTHAAYKGDKLVHHHDQQGWLAYAIPDKVHRKWTARLHAFRNSTKLGGIAGKLVSLFGVMQNVFSQFTAFSTGNPDAWINWFGSMNQVGKIYYHAEKGVYFQIKHKVETKDANGRVVRAKVTYDVFADYVWDDDENEYMGVGKLGTFSEDVDVVNKTSYDSSWFKA